jgi:predicted DCC family thiol-disulfide oxidoreductase YuxK
MNTLHIFYDSRCGLCSSFRQWMQSQAALVQIHFLPYDSAEALKLCPSLPSLRADQEIVCMADDGRYWQGGDAWLTCLWALDDYREWSFTLERHVPKAAIRRVVQWISSRRIGLSRLLMLRPDQLTEQAAEVACDTGSCAR